MKPCVRDLLQNACGCIVGLVLRPCRQNKLGALVGQSQRRLKPDAAVCTRDHSPSSSLRGNIFGSPFGLHGSSIRPIVSSGNKAPFVPVHTWRKLMKKCEKKSRFGWEDI